MNVCMRRRYMRRMVIASDFRVSSSVVTVCTCAVCNKECRPSNKGSLLRLRGFGKDAQKNRGRGEVEVNLKRSRSAEEADLTPSNRRMDSL